VVPKEVLLPSMSDANASANSTSDPGQAFVVSSFSIIFLSFLRAMFWI
jgi:hypothetical protein